MDHVGGGGGAEDHRSGSQGKGRGSWTNNPPPLRRPHNVRSASVNQVGEMLNNVSINDVVRNSHLSAEAREFTPRSAVNLQMLHNRLSRTSVQNRIDLARNADTRNQSYQHQQYPYQYQETSNQPSSYNNISVDDGLDKTLSQLNTAMQKLSSFPDQFENLVSSLVDTISPHLENEAHARAIISTVILKCLSDCNFRYSGVRLCSHIDAANSSSSSSYNFRTALYECCEQEANNLAETWPKIKQHTVEDEQKCRGLMLSLAELVAQMNSEHAVVLGKRLIEVISTTLKNPGPTSAKFICQSLKLAGQYLERESSTNRDEIERVMKELSSLVIQGRVDVHTGRMVDSVKELRNGNWGQGISSHGPTPVEINQRISQNQVQPQYHQQQYQHQHQQQQQQHQPQQFDEPVLYGPDGMILSSEERQFCQNLANFEYDSEDSSIVAIQQDLGLDPLEEAENDMMAEAYEEFLKLPPNLTPVIKK
ncbi:polyadenylate-binding protein-interacting protein 1 [Chelonus insularis]|uniref:polyadenylate-binding protein-interacting protein 1 n=1 Tax=Chelonus insularis TaxID=460826 RepID=UPI00158E1A8A|nr:polyadenylate-binding protein-interacting protein 1-like [Chelonus insularis]